VNFEGGFSGSTIRTFLLFFRVVSGDYGKACFSLKLAQIENPSLKIGFLLAPKVQGLKGKPWNFQGQSCSFGE